MNCKIFNVELITSRSNSTIVKIGKLENKKYRNEEKLFVCNGVKLFNEAYKFGAKIEYVIINNEINLDEEIIEKLQELKSKEAQIVCVSESVFAKISSENAPQGIITVCKYCEEIHSFSTIDENDYSNEKIMLFESVRDPGNIGTIIRNAAAFGIDRIIMSSDCADIYSLKVIRAAMGAIFKVKISIVEDFASSIKMAKMSGKRVLAATLGHKALELGKERISASDAIVIGNEGHGISNEIISLCDSNIIIPMAENTESLNAAIATAIFMWELK